MPYRVVFLLSFKMLDQKALKVLFIAICANNCKDKIPVATTIEITTTIEIIISIVVVISIVVATNPLRM